jgi:hypothetical protein
VIASFLISAIRGESDLGQWFAADGLPAALSDGDRARVADALEFHGEVYSR